MIDNKSDQALSSSSRKDEFFHHQTSESMEENIDDDLEMREIMEHLNEEDSDELEFNENAEKYNHHDENYDHQCDGEEEEQPQNGELRFVCDTTIPGVAKHLRMLGVDTLHDNNYSQNYILYLARTQKRMILTFSLKMQKKIHQIRNNLAKKRERLEELKKRLQTLIDQEEQQVQNGNSVSIVVDKNCLTYDKWKDTREKLQTRIEQYEMDLTDSLLSYHYDYYLLQTKGRYNQISEVVNQFKIKYIPEKLFTRCASCSGTLRKIENKESVKHLLEQNTYDDNDHYSMCNRCHQLFWGIHIENPTQREAVEKAIAFCKEYSYHDEEDGVTSSASNNNDDNKVIEKDSTSTVMTSSSDQASTTTA
ncbi:hypothetical protein C9374_003966 [Naegleria lovaniensis]|uniref:Mut7-C RNAse domain-containing protein n=1 Tax=Naegleria lovaniensis TaxID=51637 RepID=A0AA88H8Y0_NAELO|nr:uncharacterized protein C9374_003966 [Naegleria lovaniensis]KAG2394202.1 hypothetical protein C9374_003966 [Naegleria lovaniensis]